MLAPVPLALDSGAVHEQMQRALSIRDTAWQRPKYFGGATMC